MISDSLLIKAMRLPLTVVVLCLSFAVSHLVVADTIVNIDLDDQGDLQKLFNPDSNPRFFNDPAGGLGNTGVVNSEGGQSTNDYRTPRIGYSVIALAELASLAPAAIATTAIGAGGCSVAGSGQPDMTLTALLVFSVVYLTLVRAGTLRTLKCALLLFVSTSLAAGPTIADVQTGLYLGIGGGASRLMPEITNATLASRDSVGKAWNATAGFQLTRSLGLEMEYANLGTTTLDPLGSIDYQDVNVSGLYHLGGAAVNGSGRKFSIYGRLGVGKISNQSNIQLQKGSSAHWLAGAGVQIPLGRRLALRAEGVNYDTDVTRLGLSVTYRMGTHPLPSIGPIAQRISQIIGLKGRTESADNHTNAASRALASEQAKSTPQDSDKPYYPGADQHPPYRRKTQSIEQMMAFKPPPKKQYLMSESTRKRMQARSEPVNGSDEKQTALRQATVIMDDETRLGESHVEQTLDQTPKMSAALPVSSDHEISEAEQKPVQFEFDSSTLSERFHEQLRPLVERLRTRPDARLTLTGHTDSVGSEQYNQLLSIRRAEAVRQFLLKQGIDRKMIRILGAGEKRPVKSNAKPSGRKANRRVSIVVN